MSRHFNFDRVIKSPVSVPESEAWYSSFWRPSFLELPDDWYVPERYEEIFDGTWLSNDCNTREESSRRKKLYKEYRDVLSQYKGSIYNELWVRDNQLAASVMQSFVVQWVNDWRDKVYRFMYRSWLFPWVDKEPVQKFVFAEKLDLHTMDFHRNIQECNSRIFTNAVEITMQFAAPILALALLIYGFKSDYVFDRLGLDIINGVLVRK